MATEKSVGHFNLNQLLTQLFLKFVRIRDDVEHFFTMCDDANCQLKRTAHIRNLNLQPCVLKDQLKAKISHKKFSGDFRLILNLCTFITE